jgi:general secretion pathway protein D
MTAKRIKPPYVLALALSMTGCEFIGPQLHTKLPLPDVERAQEEPMPALPDLNADASKKTTKVELYPNGESSISQQTSAATGERSSGKGEYSLNFDDADLGEVAKVILSDILGKNYTISPQVTGKVTLQTTKPLTKEELMPTLDMLLGVNNAALVNQNGMYLIKPASEAVYSASVRTMGGMPSGYQTRVIPVRNVSASEIADILKPLLPEKSLLQADPSRNILLVAGSGSELSRVMELVSIFDVDVLKGRSFALFTPAHVDASRIIEELDQIFNNGAKKDREGGDSSFFRFIEIERLNAVLAITHQASYLRDIENWVLRLDRTNTEAGGGINVYRAQHVSAAELADTLNDIFGSGSSRRSKSASIASGRKALSASNKKTGSGGGNTSSSAGSASSTGNSGSTGKSDIMADRSLSDRTQNTTGNRGLTGSATGGNSEMPNVKIIADEGNNALIIVASSEEYAKIQRVLRQLDVLPLQVMIDATIVEVTLKDDLQYGIQWYLQHNNGGTNAISGGAKPGLNLTNLAKDIAAGVGTGGFSYAFSSGSQDINAVLQAGAANNNINVISSPSLMVLNNQEASIKVGNSVPIRSSVSTNLSAGTTTPIQTSSIQMIDTGINLAVRPRVNSNGIVLMDILQTSNKAIDSTTTTGAGIDSPTIQKREIETSVVVQSGETVVLGGLIEENNDYSRFGVPVLHEIPLIGPLFGSTTRNKDKTELVVLLTPRVMKSRQDAQDVTEEFKRKLSGIYDPSLTVDVEVIR